MTRAFLSMAKEKFRLRDQRVVSYGPCQTPTLWFCVQRHKEIKNFQPQQFFTVSVMLNFQVILICIGNQENIFVARNTLGQFNFTSFRNFEFTENVRNFLLSEISALVKAVKLKLWKSFLFWFCKEDNFKKKAVF